MHYERIDKYMKRVKEIASMLEVSQVTVYNHLKKLDDELKGNIFKKKGVIYVDDEGIRQLKISMGLLEVPTIRENISMDIIINNISNQVTDQVKEAIQENYNRLESDIEELKEQNKKLMELIEENQNKTILDKIKEIFKK